MWRVRSWLAVSGFGLSIAGTTFADQVVLEPAQDTTIYQSSGTTSNGSGMLLFSGLTNTAGLRRSLLRFDLSSIPQGSTITLANFSVTLSLTIGGNGPASLHRVLEEWGEGHSDAGLPGGNGAPATPGDATWTHRLFDTATWTTSGGEFVAMPSVATTLNASFSLQSFPSTTRSVADVQLWLDQPATNFGWILRCDEGVAGNARRFVSREDPTAASRPQLIVEFTPPVPSCRADFNGVGGVTVQDIFDFLAAYFSGGPTADFNGVGGVTVQDIFDFLAAYFTSCP